MKRLLLSLTFATICFSEVCFGITALSDKQFFKAVIDNKKVTTITQRRASIKDKDGRTALMYAAKNGNLVLVNKLLEKGADINARDNYGRSPLTFAIESYDMAIAGSKGSVNDMGSYFGANDILSLIDRKTELERIITKLKEELVKQLEKKGQDINAKNNDGRTILMLAAAEGNIFLVEKLIEKGADVNIKDNKGNNAIMLAAQRFFDMAFYSSKDYDNSDLLSVMFTSQFWERVNRLLDVLTKLRKEGADTSIKDDGGLTCFDYVRMGQAMLQNKKDENQTEKAKAKKAKTKKGKNKKKINKNV